VTRCHIAMTGASAHCPRARLVLPGNTELLTHAEKTQTKGVCRRHWKRAEQERQ